MYRPLCIFIEMSLDCVYCHITVANPTLTPHFDLGGIYLVILKGRPIPAQNPMPPRFPLIAFAVKDLDAAVDQLRAHHVELPWGVEEDANSRWAMFHDPAGNLIELVQFKHAATHSS